MNSIGFFKKAIVVSGALLTAGALYFAQPAMPALAQDAQPEFEEIIGAQATDLQDVDITVPACDQNPVASEVQYLGEYQEGGENLYQIPDGWYFMIKRQRPFRWEEVHSSTFTLEDVGERAYGVRGGLGTFTRLLRQRAHLGIFPAGTVFRFAKIDDDADDRLQGWEINSVGFYTHTAASMARTDVMVTPNEGEVTFWSEDSVGVDFCYEISTAPTPTPTVEVTPEPPTETPTEPQPYCIRDTQENPIQEDGYHARWYGDSGNAAWRFLENHTVVANGTGAFDLNWTFQWGVWYRLEHEVRPGVWGILTGCRFQYQIEPPTETATPTATPDVTPTPEAIFPALGDRVWFDDGNGQQDAGEPGVANVIVQLIEAQTGLVMLDTTTDGNGFYLFDNLEPGDFYVVFAPVEGYLPTLANAEGVSDELDSDVTLMDGELRSHTVTLAGGERNMTVDMGIIAVPVEPAPTCEAPATAFAAEFTNTTVNIGDATELVVTTTLTTTVDYTVTVPAGLAFNAPDACMGGNGCSFVEKKPAERAQEVLHLPGSAADLGFFEVLVQFEYLDGTTQCRAERRAAIVVGAPTALDPGDEPVLAGDLSIELSTANDTMPADEPVTVILQVNVIQTLSADAQIFGAVLSSAVAPANATHPTWGTLPMGTTPGLYEFEQEFSFGRGTVTVQAWVDAQANGGDEIPDGHRATLELTVIAAPCAASAGDDCSEPGPVAPDWRFFLPLIQG